MNDSDEKYTSYVQYNLLDTLLMTFKTGNMSITDLINFAKTSTFYTNALIKQLTYDTNYPSNFNMVVDSMSDFGFFYHRIHPYCNDKLVAITLTANIREEITNHGFEKHHGTFNRLLEIITSGKHCNLTKINGIDDILTFAEWIDTFMIDVDEAIDNNEMLHRNILINGAPKYVIDCVLNTDKLLKDLSNNLVEFTMPKLRRY